MQKWKSVYSPKRTGKPKDEVLPVELFLCGDCGEVLNELLPPGLKVEEEA